jgi:hypothetical protein
LQATRLGDLLDYGIEIARWALEHRSITPVYDPGRAD